MSDAMTTLPPTEMTPDLVLYSIQESHEAHDDLRKGVIPTPQDPTEARVISSKY